MRSELDRPQTFPRVKRVLLPLEMRDCRPVVAWRCTVWLGPLTVSRYTQLSGSAPPVISQLAAGTNRSPRVLSTDRL